MTVEELRVEIDKIDHKLLAHLNERVQLAAEIGRLKNKNGDEIYVPKREEEVLSRLNRYNEGPLTEKAIRAIYREIMSAAIALEKEISVAYLGPEATYTHQAALKKFGSGIGYVALPTISDVFGVVENGESDYGVIPIENSTEGAVIHSLDMFAESDLKIIAQVFLEISHQLISVSPLEEITKVYSKDQALGQCRRWLQRHLPNAICVDSDSTAGAVQLAKENPGCAAIASSLAAELYDVPVVAEGIQDNANNTTRFLVIGRKSSGAIGNGKDKSSYLISVSDEVGALEKALAPFSARGINLTKIESRPSRKKAWDYYFFIDIQGHNDDENVKEAIAEIKECCAFVKWLGSFPDTV